MNQQRELVIAVRGMTCDHCERTVSNALRSVPGVLDVREVSHASALARVAAGPEATAEQIEHAVARAGFQAHVRKDTTTAAPAVIARREGNFDLIIVGGGSAGFAAAIKGSELGARIALVEGGTLGGTCVNVGCVPSKTLLRAAEANYRRTHHGFGGIPATDGRPDWALVRGQKDDLVNELRQAKYWDVLRSYAGVTLVPQRATLTSAHEIRLADGRTLSAGKTLITTGSSPWAPPIPGLADAGYLDNASAMALERLPDSLAVIGASAVGLELAQMFARLGVKVTILEAQPRVAPAEDPAIGDALGDYLRAEGLEVQAGVQVEQVSRAKDGYTIRSRSEGQSRIAQTNQLLVATGRRANTRGFGLETVGVALGPKAELVVNDYLQTGNPDVYGAGDVLGDPMFVYVAAYGGTVAAENALVGNTRRYDLSALPKVTFTDPAIASVGPIEFEMRARGEAPLVSVLPMEYVPRALAARDTRGFIKLLADPSTRQLLAAHILASEAGEMITEVALAIKSGLTVEDLTSTFHPYLTLSEGIKLAAQTFSKDVKMLSCCAA
jgi:mercuric reductase